ncbi:unnamed protein product [Strongylus vulgaris]|uniref:Uncharacterized protein n=1 Tax=Strongylus vulgaris TaxID=40348 RepID=A0A3P7HVY7_STRVU|nr:unnamed protein product [Strongylus vulgaris]
MDNIEGSEWMVVIAMLIHLLMAPGTKVEESFNVQATHDLIYHTYNISALHFQYDHNEFPGVVPRTFAGPIYLALFGLPMRFIFFLLDIPKFWMLFIGREKCLLLNSSLAYVWFSTLCAWNDKCACVLKFRQGSSKTFWCGNGHVSQVSLYRENYLCHLYPVALSPLPFIFPSSTTQKGKEVLKASLEVKSYKNIRSLTYFILLKVTYNVLWHQPQHIKSSLYRVQCRYACIGGQNSSRRTLTEKGAMRMKSFKKRLGRMWFLSAAVLNLSLYTITTHDLMSHTLRQQDRN